MNLLTIVKNSIYLFFSHVLVRFVSGIATILVARSLGIDEYGLLSLAISITIISGFFTELGLTHTLIREGTKAGSDIEELLAIYLGKRLFYGGLTLLVTCVLILTLYSPSHYQVLLWCVIPSILGSVLTGYGVAYFQVTQLMKFTALIRASTGLLTALSLLLCFYLKSDVFSYSLAYGFSILFGGVISTGLVLRKVRFKLKWSNKLSNGLISFSISGFVVMFFPQLGPIILEKTSSLTQVGNYSAAYRIPSILYQIPNVLALAFYPMLFKLSNANNNFEQVKLNIMQTKFMSCIGMMLCLPFAIYSEWWVNIVLGRQWVEAAFLLSVLSFIVLLQSISSPISDGLAAAGYHKKRSIFQVANCCLAVILFLLLSSRYGAVGAAFAAVIVELINLIGLVALRKIGIVIIYKSLGSLAPIFITMLLLGYYLKGISWLNPVLGVVILFSLFLILTFSLDKELKGKLVNVLKKQVEKKTKSVKIGDSI
ncbi:oligosaccharide flippase family protein [Paenibacillus sp. FSL W8-1187]|uniref:lipopolysaccharide biosynthesis protein n=1 Tax=Paenibacillus sp. FSL W8-1187 TaxID=2975339 RepID=UPI0030D7DCA3